MPRQGHHLSSSTVLVGSWSAITIFLICYKHVHLIVTSGGIRSTGKSTTRRISTSTPSDRQSNRLGLLIRRGHRLPNNQLKNLPHVPLESQRIQFILRNTERSGRRSIGRRTKRRIKRNTKLCSKASTTVKL